ncbi:hypothetical protein HN014_22470 (plasmid) [Aquimarina sp. TRL1]|uniref:hypothetical protein n=1 Tax=Aquimarina sp. (strain TRL1) TaxID=2736252 RepID=UPI00158A31C9|nr:hypothetical protein [Aquimarina sp. TRL1]QKX07767.1 hypothetical protein HN014_22470 [Aquimarina sp. TRL1]
MALTDIELIDKYCETCLRFINPQLFREIQNRGLYNIINYLPSNEKEAKSVARGRLAKIGKSFGDAEIDQIANEIQRVEFLRNELIQINMADAHKAEPILKEMLDRTMFIKNYYKQ